MVEFKKPFLPSDAVVSSPKLPLSLLSKQELRREKKKLELEKLGLKSILDEKERHIDQYNRILFRKDRLIAQRKNEIAQLRTDLYRWRISKFRKAKASKGKDPPSIKAKKKDAADEEDSAVKDGGAKTDQGEGTTTNETESATIDNVVTGRDGDCTLAMKPELEGNHDMDGKG